MISTRSPALTSAWPTLAIEQSIAAMRVCRFFVLCIVSSFNCSRAEKKTAAVLRCAPRSPSNATNGSGSIQRSLSALVCGAGILMGACAPVPLLGRSVPRMRPLPCPRVAQDRAIGGDTAPAFGIVGTAPIAIRCCPLHPSPLPLRSRPDGGRSRLRLPHARCRACSPGCARQAISVADIPARRAAR